MVYDIPPPRELPEPGYYYHFKHDPDGPLNNYAYYIYGVGRHTEDDCRTEDAFMQVYRPLYEEAYAYRNGGLFDLRPLHMFFEPAEWKGKEVPRFHENRRPRRDCTIRGNQGSHVPESLDAPTIENGGSGSTAGVWGRSSERRLMCYGTKRNYLGAQGISGAGGRPAVPSTWRRQPPLTP